MQEIALWWLRRDLRLQDNAALFHALQSGMPVLPVFIFDKNILNKLADKHDARVHFIHNELTALNQQLKQIESSLHVAYGTPLEALKQIISSYEVKAVFTNHDYEPYATSRDNEIGDFLKSKNIRFQTYKDQVILEKNEVLKDDGTPYTVFTPYKNKYLKLVNASHLQSHKTETLFHNFLKTSQQPIPELHEMGFHKTAIKFPSRNTKKQLIKTYDETRNYPGIEGTSRLSLHLRFGTISIRQLMCEAMQLNHVYQNELIWREFYMMILHHFPHVEHNSFKSNYDQITWINNEKHFEAWCTGNTGYPIVDAGMRELNATGHMHNRVRMITASFLTKHLLTDWRWGESYFANKLLDFELASNNGGWQWAAGCGVDAAPYFRIFSPYEQTKKFDPQLSYIKKWVPEFSELTYAKPVIEHTAARQRCLQVYKQGLTISR
ncbi:MAG: deoxyribodipyrimidine photo-lyase [Bacteroidetes bacterium]|nr:deoxyribodipyrimidine photo-lyase [Bacteroidota bacterium]